MFSLLSDAKLTKQSIQNVLDIYSSCDATERIGSLP